MLTHHADSWLRATLPAAGTYYLHLYDAQNQGGAGVCLPLADQPAAARFPARIVPSGMSVRRGGLGPYHRLRPAARRLRRRDRPGTEGPAAGFQPERRPRAGRPRRVRLR